MAEAGSAMAGVRQFDEAATLAAALEVFWTKGLAATSMQDLATATGVQRGSLYNAYGDKETLFQRAFDLYAARFLAAIADSLAGDDAEAALKGVFRTAIATMTAGSPARGCLTTKTASDGSTASPEVKARLADLLDQFATLVRIALDRPDFRARLALDPAATADVVVTFTRGLAVMERVHGDPGRLAETARALVKALVHPAPGRAF